MKNPALVQGLFLHRDNRFRATVQVAGRDAWAHVPNSGRLAELLVKNRSIWLSPAATPGRKTAYDLKLVQTASTLVSVDARLPNPLFAEALAAGRLPGFSFPIVKREVSYNHSRLDFQLSGPEGICWVETKSVTLVEEGTALFPDAPTSRGRRHLECLIELKEKDHQAAVVFVIQRPDALRFTPHREADPEFTIALNKASAAGVEVRAFTCLVSLAEIVIADEIPVLLAGNKAS